MLIKCKDEPNKFWNKVLRTDETKTNHYQSDGNAKEHPIVYRNLFLPIKKNKTKQASQIIRWFVIMQKNSGPKHTGVHQGQEIEASRLAKSISRLKLKRVFILLAKEETIKG